MAAKKEKEETVVVETTVDSKAEPKKEAKAPTVKERTFVLHKANFTQIGNTHISLCNKKISIPVSDANAIQEAEFLCSLEVLKEIK